MFVCALRMGVCVETFLFVIFLIMADFPPFNDSRACRLRRSTSGGVLLLLLLSSMARLVTTSSALTALVVRGRRLLLVCCVLLILASRTWAPLLLTRYIAILNGELNELKRKKLIRLIQIY